MAKSQGGLPDPGRKFLYNIPAACMPEEASGRPPVARSTSGVLGHSPEGSPAKRGSETQNDSGAESTAGGTDPRWTSALSNLDDMGATLEAFQKVLLTNAVYLDEQAYSRTAAEASHGRALKNQERRIRALEKEVDDARAAAGVARAEKRLAEQAQKAAEKREREAVAELESTTKVFQLHLDELRLKQEEINKKQAEIEVLQAIINTMSVPGPTARKSRS